MAGTYTTLSLVTLSKLKAAAICWFSKLGRERAVLGWIVAANC